MQDADLMRCRVVQSGDYVEFYFYKVPIKCNYSRKHKIERQDREEGELCEKRLDNLYRARMNIRRIIWCNECKYTKMITLTYAKTCLDVKKVQRDIQTFVQNMRRMNYDFKYLYVLEHQKERGLREGNAGSIHIHLILFLQKYVKIEDLNKAWKHGNTDILASRKIKNLGAYISKYISKENFADFGKRCYSCSLGLERSQTERFYTLRYSDSMFDVQPEDILRDCNVTYSNKIHFDYLNSEGVGCEQEVRYFQGKWKNNNSIIERSDPLNAFARQIACLFGSEDEPDRS